MGTEGPHAAAHHSPLLAGIVVGDFKSKARDEVPQEEKLTISGRPASSELIFQRRRFQEIDVTHRLRADFNTKHCHETRSRWLPLQGLGPARASELYAKYHSGDALKHFRKCRSPISFTCRILTIQACGICIAIQT